MGTEERSLWFVLMPGETTGRKEEGRAEGHELQADANIPLLSSPSPSGQPAPL